MILKLLKGMSTRVKGPIRIERKQKNLIVEFLPAALEIQEMPPSPIGRSIIWSIVMVFIFVITWGVVGKMDVVASAHGKIIPSGRIKIIQPMEMGKVKTIHVVEGQSVKAGDPLVTFDSTATQADVNQLTQQLGSAKLVAARQQSFHQLLKDSLLDSNWQSHRETPLHLYSLTIQSQPSQPDANFADSDAQHRLLVEQINEYRYQRESLLNELAKRKAAEQRTLATLTKIQRTLPLITERTHSLEQLMYKNMVARNQYLELEQERIVQEQDLLALEAQFRELQAASNSIKAQLKTIKAEAQKNNLAELNATTQQIEALGQELIKAQERNNRQIISAPIDGDVQQLAIHTVGGVVTPAQKLMVIVPRDTELEVEALVLNKDIGFVEEGQVAEVKIDTFNFTKYGLVGAKIIHISNDAIADENLGLVYKAKVLLEKTQLWVDQKWVNLGPGMSVTVEVKTGKRRIVEYFLSPLLRYKQESIRER